MIVRKFVFQHHDEHGFNGWRPRWITHFDPSEGLGVAHDTLEHTAHDAGTVESEFMAFGAIAWLRGQGGWFHENRSHNPDIAFHMSGDFPQQAEFLASEGRRMKAAPTTRPLVEDDEDETLQRCIARGMALIRDEFASYEADDLTRTAIDPVSALSYMRMGFRRAARRYASSNPFDMSHMFNEIRKGADRHATHAELGDVLVVRVDVPYANVEVKLEQSY